MTDITYVFVHGGQHHAACWAPTITAMRAMDAGVRTLAVNLPGHGDEPGDLATLTIEQCVDSVVRQIQQNGADRVVLVGHSMAGITLPGVAIRMGVSRVARMVFVSCCIPPEGKSVHDTLRWPIRPVVRWVTGGRRVSPPLRPWAASFFFSNGMSTEQKAQTLACLCPESAGVARQAVTRKGLPQVHKTWVLLRRDRALSVRTQRQFIRNLGGVDDIVELDTCHNAMISEPHQLAQILLSRNDTIPSAT